MKTFLTGFFLGGCAGAVIALLAARGGSEPRTDTVTISREELHALRQASERPVASEGEAPQAPADLPSRLSGDGLKATLELGLQEIGANAQILAVDCSEYPCFVAGRAEDREILGKLIGSAAFDGHRTARDHFTSYMQALTKNLDGKTPPKGFLFALAARTRDEPTDDAGAAHIQRRMRASLDSLASQRN